MIEFFDSPNSLYLPVPFSLILVIFLPIWRFFELCWGKKKNNDSNKSDHLSASQLNLRRKHAKLMQELIMRLIKKMTGTSSLIQPQSNG